MKQQNEPDPVLERTRKNVLNFYDTALNQKKPAEAIARYAGSEYRQHNPRCLFCNFMRHIIDDIQKSSTKAGDERRGVFPGFKKDAMVGGNVHHDGFLVGNVFACDF